MSIKIGIYGYGNLAKGVELAVKANPDMELAAVFTRRDPSTVKIATEGAVVASSSDIASFKDKIDVIIICGGSATDLPEQTPAIAKLFNCVDSFDTHAKIPEHFANVDAAAKSGSNTALISCGWDPGMFSLATASFPTAKITHSGARAYPRATPMRSGEYPASRTANSTRSL